MTAFRVYASLKEDEYQGIIYFQDVSTEELSGRPVRVISADGLTTYAEYRSIDENYRRNYNKPGGGRLLLPANGAVWL